jgi:pre-mRNA-processing factor SLU7
LDTGAPSLSHQRRPEYDNSANKLDNWYDRGAKAGPAAKKYRKGACENCGAMTHKKPDCLERPRKKGAKYTNRDIQADEVVQEVASGYDAKRDRWNGYDAAEHSRIYEEYTAVEAARQKLREEEIDNQTTTDLAAVRKVAKAGKTEGKGGDADFGSSDEEDADEDKYADAADAVGQKLDAKTRITVRNLRIREDTAKYLINLDPESAYYDPKTRSMRDAPLKNIPASEVSCLAFVSYRHLLCYPFEKARFAGDNFFRYSGEAPEVQELQLFAWQAAARGNDVHLNANPTQGQLLHHEFKQRKEELKDTSKVSILARYGGAEYLETAPKELREGQTENYVEYSRTGQVIKGRERAKARSKYPEDGEHCKIRVVIIAHYLVVFINNHTAVWGSWYDSSSSTWGYACCHSVIHITYCSGFAGIEAAQASTAQSLLSSAVAPAVPSSSNEVKNDIKEESTAKVEQNYSKKRVGEGDVKLDEARLAQAINEEKKRKFKADNDGDDTGKKRKQGGSHDVTEEELGKFQCSIIHCSADVIFRGVSYEPSDDRRSHGELHRPRQLKSSHCFSFTFAYINTFPIVL